MGTGEQQVKQTAGAADPVWQQYGQWLQRYLTRCLRHHDAASAQDLAQEVYLRLLRVDKGEPVRNWQAYLYRIASHVVYEFKMRARQEIVSFDSEAVDNWEEHVPDGAADPAGERLNAQRQIEQALARLRPLERTILLLQKRDGLEYGEIARQLGLSTNMVHKHLTRALAALRAAQWDL